MDTVRDRNDLRMPFAGKFQRFLGAQGIARKADPDHDIFLTDPYHLLKNLTGAAGLYQTHIVKNHMKIKREKTCQRSTAADSHDINRPGIQQHFHGLLKGSAADFLHGHFDLINIRLEHSIEDLP